MDKDNEEEESKYAVTAHPTRGCVTIRQCHTSGRRCRAITFNKEEYHHLLACHPHETPAIYTLSSTLFYKVNRDGSVRLVKLTRNNAHYLQNCLHFSADDWKTVKQKVISAFADDI